MPIYRNRQKVTHVNAMKVNLVLVAGVVQVGDVKNVNPFNRSYNVGGPRGAASFITQARHIHSATRLHFAEQDDREKADFNIIGGHVPNL